MSTIAEHQKRNKNRSSYTSILKYTGLFGGVQGFNILISIIRNKCAAVLIGAAGIGLTDILNRTSDFIGSITNLGLSFSGVRQLSEDFATGEENTRHHRHYTCMVRWNRHNRMFDMYFIFVNN